MFMRNPLFNGPIPNPPQHFNQRFPNWNHLLAAAWNQSILQSLQQRAAMVNNNGMIAHPSPRISPANGNPIQTNGNHIQMNGNPIQTNGNHTPNNRGNNFTVDRIMNSPMAAERLRAEESAKSSNFATFLFEKISLISLIFSFGSGHQRENNIYWKRTIGSCWIQCSKFQ